MPGAPASARPGAPGPVSTSLFPCADAWWTAAPLPVAGAGDVVAFCSDSVALPLGSSIVRFLGTEALCHVTGEAEGRAMPAHQDSHFTDGPFKASMVLK